MIKESELIKIGYFSKPHGVKGEIRLCTEFIDIFEECEEPYLVCEIDGILIPFFIDSIRSKSSEVLLVKLARLDTDKDLDLLINQTVYFPKKMKNFNDVNYFIDNEDLIDFLVINKEGEEIGRIRNIDASTANVLLQIDHKGNDLLIPLVDEWIIRLDSNSKELVLDIPEGLMDL